jgi:hypothetical protein
MLTTAVEPPGLHYTVHDRRKTHLWTGQRCRRRSLSRQIRYCATIARRTGRSAKQRRRTSDTAHGEHCHTAIEATNARHHCLNLLRHVCRKTSAVHSSFITTSSVPVSPRSVTPRHQSSSEAGGTAFHVARHAEVLQHLGTGLPSLPTL